MSRPIPFTQAGLKRAIEGARKAGLRIKGIKPDGTLIVDDGDGERQDERLEQRREIVL